MQVGDRKGPRRCFKNREISAFQSARADVLPTGGYIASKTLGRLETPGLDAFEGRAYLQIAAMVK